MYFTPAEQVLIKELAHKPLSEAIRYFPEHTLADIASVINNNEPWYPSNPCSEILMPGKYPIYPHIPPNADFDTYMYLMYGTNKEYAKKMYAESMRLGNVYRWDKYQEEFIERLANLGYPPKNMVDIFEAKFGIPRTLGAIQSRIDKLASYS